jgi:hypothetical protein
VTRESRRPAPASALHHAEAPLVLAANAGFSDPSFRETVREMHRQEYPLVRMVADLGLDDELTPEIRAVLESLSPEVVADIRAATVAMLDREEEQLPLACEVQPDALRTGTPLTVQVTEVAGSATIQVTPT